MSAARPPEGARTAARQGEGSPVTAARPPEGARTSARQGEGSPVTAARPPEGARTAARQGEGNSSNARDAILGRLRAVVIADKPALPGVAQWYDDHQRHEDLSQRSLRLRTALEAVHTEIHDVTETNWTAVLLRIAAQKGLKQVLIGPDTPHGNALAASAPEGLEIVRYDQPIDAWQDRLFDGIDAALTLARGAIAETGSLILWPTPSEPRLMSLVPSLHFVLLDTHTIHADFHGAMTAESWAQGMPTNALLICGPSKTADIQQTLAYGAHGPRELVVLLRQPEGATA